MNSDVIKARAYYYEVFSAILFFKESDERFKLLKKQLEVLAQNPLNDACSKAYDELKDMEFEKFKKEQNNLFFDLSYANVPLTASFYEEGRDDGAARLRVIDILKQNLYVKDICSEGEDYIGFIFLIMSRFLLDESNLEFSYDSASTKLFISVINGFIDEFISMINNHEKSEIFIHISTILKTFISLERSLLNVNPPFRDLSVQSPAEISINKKPYQSKMPTAKPKILSEEFSLAES